MDESILSRLKSAEPVLYRNPHYDPEEIRIREDARVEAARQRLGRFAPFLMRAFPETAKDGGRIESPLTHVPYLAAKLRESAHFSGNLWLKKDSDLPVSGSIKARGGIYEVLVFAERIAEQHGAISEGSDYAAFAQKGLQKLLSGYEVSVGSTGNLGLSIGLIGRALGLKVTVHMSSDARAWKKERLRAIGCRVIEYDGDYEEAVRKGREEASRSDRTHFVDDENSRDLFDGYAVAGLRIKTQLASQNIPVDAEHPLFVYLPCGVGGGPGGVAYGIQNALGPHAHCLFAEPVQAPCMLLSIATQSHGALSVRDIGLHGQTEADGLAVGRASEMVSRIMTPRLDGLFTAQDDSLYPNLRLLFETEGIYIEPSAAATFAGPSLIERAGWYPPEVLSGANHVLWATGGGMVPDPERAAGLGKRP